MYSEVSAQSDNVDASAGSHSEEHTSPDDLTAAEHGPDTEAPATQQPSQSRQEGYGSEDQPGGEGEGMQGQHSNPTLPTSQQPQDQHQSLTGNSRLHTHAGGLFCVLHACICSLVLEKYAVFAARQGTVIVYPF